MFIRVLSLVAVTALAALSGVSAPTAARGAVAEWGYALSCTGLRQNGDEVHAQLYTNNTMVVPAHVVIREGGTEGRPLLVPAPGGPPVSIGHGQVVADVPLVTYGTGADAGTARVRGTYEADRPPVRVDDAYVDEGARVRITGTDQHLATDLGVGIGDEWVALTCSDAFRYTRQITSTPLP